MRALYQRCRNRLPPSLGLPLLSYAYDFIHVKCYVNRGLFSQRIYNYSAAAYFAVVYLALPPVYSCIFFINFINSYNTFETCIILYMYIHIYIFHQVLLWKGLWLGALFYVVFRKRIKNISGETSFRGISHRIGNEHRPSELPVFIAVSFPSHASLLWSCRLSLRSPSIFYFWLSVSTERPPDYTDVRGLP